MIIKLDEMTKLDEIAVKWIGGNMPICMKCITLKEMSMDAEYLTKKELVEFSDGRPRYNHIYCHRCGTMFGRYTPPGYDHSND